jgi:hypothetical protein
VTSSAAPIRAGGCGHLYRGAVHTCPVSSANPDLVRSTFAACGRGDFGSADLLHLRDCKVTRLVFYRDRYVACADLALAPAGEA